MRASRTEASGCAGRIRRPAAALAALALAVGASVGAARGQAPERAPPPGEDEADTCPASEAAEEAASARIRIGVLSPISGGSRFVGTPHKESVELAHAERGGVIPVRLADGTRQLVSVELVHLDYETDAEKAAELAEELVDCHQAVALIGPVNSGAVERVLEEVDGVAVVSALATAPKLTRELNDPDFFRLIFHDSTRMQQYANFISGRGDAGEMLVLYDESTSYGRGLCSAFRQHYKGDAAYRPWTALTEDCPDPEAAGEACGPCGRAPGGVGRAERPLFLPYYDRIQAYGAASIRAQATQRIQEHLEDVGAAVILGSSTGALPIADIIAGQEGDRIQLYLVGSSRKVIDAAPEGAITIGDPKIDPFRAETDEDRSRWTRVLQTFELVHHGSRDDFVPTAFDAYQAVHEALEEVLGRPDGGGNLAERLAPEGVRSALLRTIRTQSFNSIEGWRRVAFDSRGDLLTTPNAPIYQITRGAERVDDHTEHSWVQVSVDRNQRWFWGPVSVKLQAHSFAQDGPAEIFLTRRTQDGREVIEERRTVRFQGGVSQQDFYLLPTGEYFVRLQRQYQPANPRFAVRDTGEYWWALAVSGVVALVVVRRQRLGFLPASGAVAEKALATLVLLFLVVFLNRWIQIPFLTGAPRLTALLVGVVGGAAGPTLVTSLLSRLANRLTGGGDR